MEKVIPILSVKNLSVRFDEHVVLKDISFDVERDDTVAIIGPNGAGKSVLFKAILGLIPFKGEVVWAPGTRIGYVPQKLSVGKDIPLTVLEFLKIKETNISKIEGVLASVGFKDGVGLKTKLGALSGGEIQRVLIAYALLGDPHVLLFDEPTSGVDVAGEETIYGLIHKLQHKADLTIIFISHELEVVNQYAANVLCLNKEKICFGPPRTAIDKVTLEKMYGEEIHLYKHHEHDHV